MKPIRIALSGSGYKFPAHVGALLALRDAGYRPVEYAGTSGGSIIATLAAAGMDLDLMRDLTLKQDWSMMLKWNPLALWSGGFCNGETLYSWIDRMVGKKTFADLTTNLTVVASDVVSEEPFIFSRQKTPEAPIAKAARASASIPVVYTPVTYGSSLLMDGGMEDNIPADLLVADSVPRLGVQLVSKASPFSAGEKKLSHLVPRLLDLILTSLENAHVTIAHQSGANFAFVETGFAGGLDCNMPADIRHRLMDSGYQTTKTALLNLKEKSWI